LLDAPISLWQVTLYEGRSGNEETLERPRPNLGMRE
jgi:hypothetical protein